MVPAEDCDLALLGVVVPPHGAPFKGEVRIRDGRIVQLLDCPSGAPATQTLDVGDAYILPGAIDAHVHCLTTESEGIEAATRSAAAGGVTTVIDMPYDQGRPVRNVQALDAKIERLRAEAWVDVALLGTVQPIGGATDVRSLIDRGACGFKLSLFDTDALRFPRIPDVELIDVFTAIAAAGSIACVHAENDEVIKPLISRALASGHTDARMHARTRPPVSETQSVLKALEFAYATGCKLHICHASLPRSIELIRWYAGAGLDVSVETCPHYLLFSEEDLALQRGRLKINPPLRGASDVEDLWRQIARGDIDYVASDHAPWPLAEKVHDNIFDNHSGVPGVELLVPLFLDAALQRGLPIERAARLLATNPAQRLGLDGRKGALSVGADADVLVFDRFAEWTVDESAMHSNAGWSPYHGRRLHGRVQLTVSRGEIVWDGQQLVGRAGRGEFIRSGSAVRDRDLTGVSV